MDKMNAQIIGDIVEQEKERGPQNVTTFTRNVEAQVKELNEAIQKKFGGNAKNVVGEKLLQDAKSYAESRNEIFEGAEVGQLHEQHQADGIANMDTREIAVDDHYMDVPQDEATEEKLLKHGDKVMIHEEKHRRDQAREYDLEGIVLDPNAGEAGTVKQKDLTEGQAITAAGQTNNELVDEYVTHKEQFERVRQEVDDATIDKALKTGELGLIQQEIIEAKRDEFIEALADKNAAKELQAALAA